MNEIATLKRNLASTKSKQKKHPTQPNLATAITMGEASHRDAPGSLPGYLGVRASSIPGAGRGVVAMRPFRAGEAIVMAMGSFVPARSQTAAQQAYSFIIPGHPNVSMQCFYDDETNIVKYINSAYKTRRTPNAQLLWHGPMLVAYASRPVRVNDEVLFDYEF